MRILIVSKFAEIQGGVERHIQDLSAELRSRGDITRHFTAEDVEHNHGPVFSKHAVQEIGLVKSTQLLLWNSNARKHLKEVVAEFQPDIIHFHSIYHQLSPSILGTVPVPSVMTFHDLKFAAPCYALFRSNEFCTECVGKLIKTPAIRHKCVAESVTASFICTVEDVVHHGRYLRTIDRFIVPSHFARDIAVRSGVPTSRLEVISWGTHPMEIDTLKPPNIVAPNITYIGRLHRTKGVVELLEAWKGMTKPTGSILNIAGAGELEEFVKKCASEDPSICYHGMLQTADLSRLVQSTTVGIMPSKAPETMGMSALEFLTAGVPLISSPAGALGDLHGPGVIPISEVTVSSIREALYRALKSDEMKSLRDELKKRDFSEYTVKRMVDEIRACYERTLLNAQSLGASRIRRCKTF